MIRSSLGWSVARHRKRRSTTFCEFTPVGTSSAPSAPFLDSAMSVSMPIRSCRRLRGLRRCAPLEPSPPRSMGFCLLNNAAIGALRAREVHGLARAAVIDFDVHHGNGTQAAFETDGSLFYASTHQYPLYPGTGAANETGVGNIVNVPLRPMSGSGPFRLAMTERILPALDAFRPNLVVVSAGFDGHRSDPLAQLLLDEQDYAWVTDKLLEIAARHAEGRLVATLEGGYDLIALGNSVGSHVRTLMSV